MSVTVPSTRATLLGIAAALLWALFGTLAVLAGRLPPFQMTAMAFVIATVVGGLFLVAGRRVQAGTKPPSWRAVALSVYGLLGFHVFYFAAIRVAPILDVTLVCATWPLMLVLFSGLLPRARGGGLRWWHAVGAVIAFLGSALVILNGHASRPGSTLSGSGANIGLALAFLSAVVWSSYSVGTRLFADEPAGTLVLACATTAAGALALHLTLENTVWPAHAGNWLALLALGVGPVGIAFYIWDEGMKQGDIRLIGVASNVTPLVAAFVLSATGLGQANTSLWTAAALITIGTLVAGMDRLRR